MVEYKIGYFNDNYFWSTSTKSNFGMPRIDLGRSNVNFKMVVFGSDERIEHI
jgi:hypothetical protein